eukprot:4345151-Prorocentrum_lima.AAC.1
MLRSTGGGAAEEQRIWHVAAPMGPGAWTLAAMARGRPRWDLRARAPTWMCCAWHRDHPHRRGPGHHAFAAQCAPGPVVPTTNW